MYLDHIMARTVVQAVVKANSKSNGNGKIYICDRLLTDVNVITGVTVHKIFMDKMLIFAVLQWWLLRLRETNSILWSPYVIGQTIIFLLCGFYLLSSSFFPRLISAVGDWMSTIVPHMVWP